MRILKEKTKEGVYEKNRYFAFCYVIGFGFASPLGLPLPRCIGNPSFVSVGNSFIVSLIIVYILILYIFDFFKPV